MEEKSDIAICLGSSCFSRGNRKSLQYISAYLKDNRIEEKVFFHGNRCFGKCEKGPILKISDSEYEFVEPGQVKYILSEWLKK